MPKHRKLVAGVAGGAALWACRRAMRSQHNDKDGIDPTEAAIADFCGRLPRHRRRPRRSTGPPMTEYDYGFYDEH
jgi:hypothetical protein